MKTFKQFISEAQSDKERQAYFDKIRRQAAAAGDRFPELVAAQAALESGWGSSPSGKNNYFGQKADNREPGTVRRTREVYGGKDAYIDAKFKDYDDESASVRDRIRKWSYKYGDAKDLETAASRLQLPGGSEIPGSRERSHGAYATDPNYASTVSRIARDYGGSTNKPGSASSSPSKPVIAKGSLDKPEPTRVLSKLKGKTGELDKTTGKFSKRDWSNTEGSRYKKYGGK